MDTDIRKSNKIPGYNQLTRPEEIAALSKYLGELKKDPYIKLDKDSLEVPGKDTPQVPKIDELYDYVLSPQEQPVDVNLEETKIGLNTEEVTELVDKRVSLESKEDIKLETRVRKLKDQEYDVELEKHSEKLKGELKPLELNGEKEKLHQDKFITSLEDNVEKLSDRRNIDLETEKEKLENTEKNIKLETEKTLLKTNEENLELSNKKEELKKPEEDLTLSDFIDSLEETEDVELEDSLYLMGDVEDVSNLSNSKIRREQNQNREVDRLVNQTAERLASENDDDLDELEDTVIPNDSNEDLENLEDHKETINPTEINSLRRSRVDELRAIIREANDRLEEDGLYDTAIRLFQEEGSESEWANRIASLMSAYLSGSRISPERAEEYEEILLSSLTVPISQSQNDNGIDQLPENRQNLEDTNEIEGLYEEAVKLKENENSDEVEDEKYYDVRRVPAYDWASDSFWSKLGSIAQNGVSGLLRKTAEDMIGPWAKGTLRATLINETLGLLVKTRTITEKALKINKDRLPGDEAKTGILTKTITGGLSGSLGDLGYTSWDVKSGVQNLIKGKTKSSFVNLARGSMKDAYEYTIGGENENSQTPLRRPVSTPDSNYLNRQQGFGKEVNEYFKDGRLCYTAPYTTTTTKPLGLNLTLQELCNKSVNDITKDGVNTADELLKILEKSDNITTARKVNKGKVLTLDSNMYWEIVMEPWLNDGTFGEAINGGYSFLPSVREINTVNLVEHGVVTFYNKWIPISGFELQKSKITTKSLGLFDGEINYPVTSEFTNEFRMTIVDDQWKSWKHYFQKCADVSVYNSEEHTGDHYFDPNPIPTAVDKETMCAAFYKNITFLISVYIMTPQYFTTRAFYLLCVLKDFSEDYTGEVDSGGTDLNVSFSIVGELEENPFSNLQDVLPKYTRTTFSIKDKDDSLERANRLGMSALEQTDTLCDIPEPPDPPLPEYTRPTFSIEYEDDSLSRADELTRLAFENDPLCPLDRKTITEAETNKMWREFKTRQLEGKSTGSVPESAIHWELIGG